VDDFEKSFLPIRALLKKKQWPGVEEGLSWSTPSLKVNGKMLVRVREPGVLVLMCNLEAKEMLLQVAPHIYFDLPHYKGYPAILVHQDKIEDDELAEMIEEHYRRIAKKKLVEEFDSRSTGSASKATKPKSAVAPKPKSKSASNVKKSKAKPKIAPKAKLASKPKI
jgi:hypothetical protein